MDDIPKNVGAPCDNTHQGNGPNSAGALGMITALASRVRAHRSAADALRDIMRPPSRDRASRWADANRIMVSKTSPEPGPWRTSRVPYTREIMDTLSDPMVREVIWMAASQVGKALALDTPLPTPEGWTTMGELGIGDLLYDEKGQPCPVTFAMK